MWEKTRTRKKCLWNESSFLSYNYHSLTQRRFHGYSTMIFIENNVTFVLSPALLEPEVLDITTIWWWWWGGSIKIILIYIYLIFTKCPASQAVCVCSYVSCVGNKLLVTNGVESELTFRLICYRLSLSLSLSLSRSFKRSERVLKKNINVIINICLKICSSSYCLVYVSPTIVVMLFAFPWVWYWYAMVKIWKWIFQNYVWYVNGIMNLQKSFFV